MFTFDGRIGRGAWWGLSFLNLFLLVVGLFLAAIIFPPLTPLVYLLAVVSSWSIGTRRCHDLGWSGAMLLVGLVPLLGNLFLLVALGFVPGQDGPNRYGYKEGYVPQYIESPSGHPLNDPAASPSHLRRVSVVHPSLQDANDRAWQQSMQR